MKKYIKRTILLAVMAMTLNGTMSASPVVNSLIQASSSEIKGWTLYAYATYKALLEAMEGVPQGSVVVVKYAKFIEDPENRALNATLKDLVVSILVKSKKYHVIRDPQMAPQDKNYYEVYVMDEWLENPEFPYSETCEGNFSFSKVEVIKKSNGEVVGTAKRREQNACGVSHDRTMRSFDYIRFIEEYQADW